MRYHGITYIGLHIGVNPGGWGVATLQMLGRGLVGGRRGGRRGGSWTGRKILLYLIMYRKVGDFWREI